jgi:hypothetical protein
LPAPQPQLPFALQVSVFKGSHAVQTPPLVPHVARERVWQTPFEQQPVAQLADEHPVAAEHMPPSHMPLPHETQAAPPAPQRFEVLPAWH